MFQQTLPIPDINRIHESPRLTEFKRARQQFRFMKSDNLMGVYMKKQNAEKVKLSKELRSVGQEIQRYKDEGAATYLKICGTQEHSDVSRCEPVFQEVIIDEAGHLTIGQRKYPERMVEICKPKFPPMPKTFA